MESVFPNEVELLKELGLYDTLKKELSPIIKMRTSIAAGSENSKTNFTVQLAANTHRLNAGKSDSSRHLSQAANAGFVKYRKKGRATTKVKTK
jgi:hypothetical protein